MDEEEEQTAHAQIAAPALRVLTRVVAAAQATSLICLSLASALTILTQSYRLSVYMAITILLSYSQLSKDTGPYHLYKGCRTRIITF